MNRSVDCGPNATLLQVNPIQIRVETAADTAATSIVWFLSTVRVMAILNSVVRKKGSISLFEIDPFNGSLGFWSTPIVLVRHMSK